MATYVIDIKPKKISVFMIAFNHQRYIAQALDSILMQKVNFDYEIVVGEDYSTDDTRNIILDYQRRYPDRFKLLLHSENLGASQNQIQTLRACKGDYIAMLEGDDYWIDPFKLQKQVDYLEANPGFVITCHSNYNLLPNKKLELSKRIISNDELSIVDLSKGTFISTLSVVFRNHIILEFPHWFYNSPVGDYPLFMLLARYGDIKYFSEPMGVYRIHTGGVWSNTNLLTNISRWIILLDNLLTEDFEDDVKRNLIDQRLLNINELLIHYVKFSFWEEFSNLLNKYSKDYPNLKDDWLFLKLPEVISGKGENAYSTIKECFNQALINIKQFIRR
nr:glycosyltransferase [Rufibacter sp. XAAS-G3-1]